MKARESGRRESDHSAHEALVKLSAHEDLCSERFATINRTLAEIQRDVRVMFNRWMLALVSVIAVLLGIVGYLFHALYGTR